MKSKAVFFRETHVDGGSMASLMWTLVLLMLLFYSLLGCLYISQQSPRISGTLPETNIFAPENGWLEYYFPFGMTYFQGLC